MKESTPTLTLMEVSWIKLNPEYLYFCEIFCSQLLVINIVL